MSTQHFTKDIFEKTLKGEKPVMVDFFSEWCGPCKMAGPVIDQLAEEYKDKVVVGKVNVDEERELAQQYGVMSIPTVIVFKDGKEVERKVGFVGKEGYQAMLDKHL
jgi:thioredoxin 1